MSVVEEDQPPIVLEEREQAPMHHLKGGGGPSFVNHFAAGGVGIMVGSLVAIASAAAGWLVGILVPLISMANFYRLGLHEKAYDPRTADALYYLGFCFTLAALLVTFTTRALFGENLSSDETLGTFGTALVTTVFGLVARTAIEQSHADANMDVAAVEASVRDLAAATTEEMEAVLAAFQARSSEINSLYAGQAEQYYKDVSSSVRQSISDYGEVVEGASESLSLSIESATTAAQSVADKFAALDQPIAKLAHTLENANHSIDAASNEYAQQFHSAAEAVGASFELASGNVKDATKAYVEATGHLSESARRSQSTIAAVNQLLDQAREITQKVADANTHLGELATEMEGARSSVSKSVNGYRSSLEKSVSDVRLATEPVAHAMGEVVEDFSSALSDLRKVVDSGNEPKSN